MLHAVSENLRTKKCCFSYFLELVEGLAKNRLGLRVSRRKAMEAMEAMAPLAFRFGKLSGVPGMHRDGFLLQHILSCFGAGLI